MKTELDRKAEKIADELIEEFTRLGVSNEDDPYSGLLAEIPNVAADKCLVEIYDDWARVCYDGGAVLDYLKTLDIGDISLESDPAVNVWQALKPFEVEV